MQPVSYLISQSVLLLRLFFDFQLKASMRASAVIHKKILAKLLKTSISFFEEMPPGKILGTISSGMDGSEYHCYGSVLNVIRLIDIAPYNYSEPP